MKNRTNKTKLTVDAAIYLSQPTEEDIPSFVKHLQEKEIYDNTLSIPFPYTEQNGKAFVNLIQDKKRKFGRLLDWGIRKQDGELIGMITFFGKWEDDPSKDEIGYWLAKPYWGQGIMTRALKRFAAFGFQDYHFDYLGISVATFNKRSQRVAEKAGFLQEKMIEKACFKDNRWIDAYWYGLRKQNSLQ